MGDSLYVMSSQGECLPSRLVRFTALIYGKPPPDSFGQDDWYWRSLPLPPFEYADHCSDGVDCCSRSDAGFMDDTSDDGDSQHPCAISAYTAVADWQIWVSTVAAGTGRAVYVPEHGLWFGFSDEGYQLCAAEFALTQQPVLHKVWQDPAQPEYLRKALMLTAAGLSPALGLWQALRREGFR
ncbi:hypothetical protein QYE76_038649 [Lolium multiflorum]|uniref:Uncharacterized protein n=1 Tax=Lolium multiflorum TaxID=4521 RepID=A0AAD8TA09_LOLMU|nr:hypothetical protein QYE76_038649 [Lolium multiflorum]